MSSNEGRRDYATYLDDLELENHSDGGSDLTFNPVHLEAVALKDNLSSREVGDSLKRRLHLRGVDGRGGHKDVERKGQQPKRGDIELTDLGRERKSASAFGSKVLWG